jgi:tetratricopeptide (TPR) repeat protein
MVETAQERRVFERHREHVRLGVADLTEPASVRTLDGERVQLGGKLRAIIHTYALQTLPSLALQRVRRSTSGGDMSEWAVLVAQTLLTDPVAAQKLLPFTPEEIRDLAQKGPAERSQLLPVLPLIGCKFALAGIELEQIELGDQAESCAEALSQALDLQRPLELAAGEGWETLWVNLPGAALSSIRRSLDALKPDGFLLYRDLGPATADGANAPLTHRTYGPVAWTPVNHFLLDRWMARPADLGGLGAHVSMPAKEALAPVQTRLVSHSPLPRTRTALALHFDPRAFEAQERLVAEARALANAGDQRALDGYRAALQVERDDWRVLAEAGEVALRNLGSPESARMFLSEALRINPWYDAPAWLAWADLNWGLGQRSAAREAIERAVAASPGHARPHAAQAALAVQERRWPLALEAVGKALARESDAETRTKLLELQRQALANLYHSDAKSSEA